MIRPMQSTDVPRVAEIHVFAQRAAYRGFVPDDFLFGDKMTVEKRIKYFADRHSMGYVYDVGFIKAFVTMGCCQDDDKPSSFEIFRIFVDQFFAREGIGKNMAKFCEEVAAERGFREICLWALEGNTKAAAFYEKIGYIPDGVRRISGFFHVPELRYVKEIRK